MEIPKDVIYIIDRLNTYGFEAYMVGGCVRDMIMGNTPKDWDITTSATPKDVIRLFPKVIETGIKHGTVTVIVNNENYEVTTYRIDGEYTDNRRPDAVIYTKNLEEDLLRRDFTMNAIAYHPIQGFIDPFCGREDIRSKIIKAVGEADKRFNEDGLRILRAVRFACQLGFEIEEVTFYSVNKNAHLLENISVERIREELVKTFSSLYVKNIRYLYNASIIKYAVPKLNEYFLIFNEKIISGLGKYNSKNEHRKTAHIMAIVLEYLKESEIHNVLTYLKFDNNTINTTKTICRYLNKSIDENRYEIKKIMSAIGKNVFVEILDLKDDLGYHTDGLREITNSIIQNKEALTIKDLKINGNDIINAFSIEGKEVGEKLEYLLDIVLKCNEENQYEILMERLKNR